MDEFMSEKEIEEDDEDTLLCCPACGGTELYYEAGMKMGRIYHCKYCNYIGAFVLEGNLEMRQLLRDEYERKLWAFKNFGHSYK
ncbi:hypothetical protein [Methanococcoides methylutens]|uniref:Uncharacterized protein n=1 Tax=Methanococcoides methylutens MM1 TaxID=1434104 RepID=A0A0E3SSK1_METMT|nr:hypothetical protein [Methanococcoides methylutens]AKB85412.1 hypothetical protein MCMEM_1359 [Methanococcoides methylutens MM1]